MSLATYRQKRHFDQTPEPSGRGDKRGERPIFVVQLHHARARHYDFRLQVGSVLKSWAVPKGPSFDPSVKRLAVEVEDHPLSYADFAGDIPEGHYGAGHVDIFDHGEWRTSGDAAQQIKKGHLHVELIGGKLRGAWSLVRSGKPARQPTWFLIKKPDAMADDVEADDLLDEPDEPPVKASRARSTAKRATTKSAAKRAATPKAANARETSDARKGAHSPKELEGAQRAKPSLDFFEPALTRLVSKPPTGDDWLHEVKWDGYRIVACIAGGKIKLWSRNGLDWTERLPDLAARLLKLPVKSAQLDGELVVLREGASDFNALQAALSGEQSAAMSYVLFDLLSWDGYDLSDTPLDARKAALAQLLKQRGDERLKYSDHVSGNGAQVFEQARKAGLEGIVSKSRDSGYRHGRSGDWLKIKTAHSEEFVVVGYTAPKGSRSGIGALLLARADAQGQLIYVGRVGTGFGDALLRQLGRELPKLAIDKEPVDTSAMEPRERREAQWIKPERIAEVEFRGWASQGLLRQAAFKTFREDKTLRDLKRDAKAGQTLAPPERTNMKADEKPARRRAASARSDAITPNKPAAKSAAASRKATPARSTRRRGASEASAGEDSEQRLSHPERVVFPEDGITKQQVFDYYRAVMPALLQEIAGRALALQRCPDGVGGQCFFQKHLTPGMGKHVRSGVFEEDGKSAPYLVVDDAAGVLELVQMNVIEFHAWGSRADDVEHADRLVFDLDPDPGVPWSRVQEAARELRARLKSLGLVAYAKLSGGKGVHVVVPLSPAAPWQQARDFSHALASAMTQAAPDDFIDVASKAKREGRIFIDYLRNGRGSTSVASWSLRARKGAPVALPIRWDELARAKSGGDFDIGTAVQRLKRQRSDPWAGFETQRQSLDEAIARLSRSA